MKAFLTIVCVLFTANSCFGRMNYMACVQNLIQGFDMLKLMSQHFSEKDFEALQAVVMGFAYEVNQINTNCDINFSFGSGNGKGFNQHDCLAQTMSFYELLKPIMKQPQEVLTDIKAFSATLSKVGSMLNACGVGLNDSQNKEIEEMIESHGDVDINALHSIKNKHHVRDFLDKSKVETGANAGKPKRNPRHFYQNGKYEVDTI